MNFGAYEFIKYLRKELTHINANLAINQESEVKKTESYSLCIYYYSSYNTYL